ncbi:hypothetical protein Taro_015937 [Colocasia esculenta]|uniref:Cathepsin propeptide inhibitor domain-containing protein n=1 Tax=Colocasia esculenta TaxID=4460 RepID=A0A843UIV6_COLES|nr:hypothetical protein [Colocasia esculenta]
MTWQRGGDTQSNENHGNPPTRLAGSSSSHVGLLTLYKGQTLHQCRGVEFRRSKEEVRWMFEDWLVRLDKLYNETTEKEHRFEVFKENLRFIKEHNHP